MKPSLYKLDVILPAPLFIMPKPSSEWLLEDVLHYKSCGIDVVVSLLENTEVDELGLNSEGAVCAANGLDFQNLPIPDRGVIDSGPFIGLVNSIIKNLNSGRGVALHCRAGIGRSGMTACCVLTGFGLLPDDAIEVASQARGVAVPDTDEQAQFIRDMTTVMGCA